jgi:zinc transporter, ZIP family
LRRVVEAFAWGAFGGAALIVGALAGLWLPISSRLVGVVMAVGAGVLISAVAFDLVEEAVETAHGERGVALGLAAGALTFFAGDWWIDRMGGANRTSMEGPQEEGSGLAIVLGAVLDGIPESIVLGLTLVGGGEVSVAFLAAVFISNLPEGLAASTGLRASGWSPGRIVGLWTGVALVSGLAALAGFGMFDCAGRDVGVRAGVRRRCRAHDARRHDDARGVRQGGPARRAVHDGRLRGRLRPPPHRMTRAPDATNGTLRRIPFGGQPGGRGGRADRHPAPSWPVPDNYPRPPEHKPTSGKVS